MQNGKNPKLNNFLTVILTPIQIKIKKIKLNLFK